MLQLLQHTEDLEEATKKLEASKAKMKLWFDTSKRVRQKPFEVGDIVLLYDGTLDNALGRKLDLRWFGPYVIREVLPRKTYRLRELDGTWLVNTYSADRLKRFVPRE